MNVELFPCILNNTKDAHEKYALTMFIHAHRSSTVRVVLDRKDRTNIQQHIFRFLQRCCQGHFGKIGIALLLGLLVSSPVGGRTTAPGIPAHAQASVPKLAPEPTPTLFITPTPLLTPTPHPTQTVISIPSTPRSAHLAHSTTSGAKQIVRRRSVSAPVPSAQQIAAPVSARHEQGSVVDMITTVFGPYASGALNVARCESGLNPAAVNIENIGGSHPVGLFQILYPSTWRGTSQAAQSPYDAYANILAAHDIFVRDGYSWREWSCRP